MLSSFLIENSLMRCQDLLRVLTRTDRAGVFTQGEYVTAAERVLLLYMYVGKTAGGEGRCDYSLLVLS